MRSRNHVQASTPERSGGTDAGERYRFDHLALSTVLKDMYFRRNDPRPGDRVPEFDLPIVSGGRFRAADLVEAGPTLLIFGSATCPVTDNAAPGLNELYRRFGERIRFVIVNVREAHPGSVLPQPKTIEAKMAHAATLRDIYGFEFEVAVDDIDGTLHRAMSPKPNSAYVLGADGTILFRAHWANDTRAVASALEAVAAGQVPRPSQSSGVVKATLRMLRNIAPVLDRAGQGAWAHMWWVAPPAAVAAALKLLGVRPRRPRRPDRSRQKQAPAAAVGDQKDRTSDEVINEPASWKAFWASTTAGISDEQRAARWPLQQLRAGRARECGERENSTAVPEQ